MKKPAIEGGKPLFERMLFDNLGMSYLAKEESDALSEVIKSKILTRSWPDFEQRQVRTFERELQEFLGRKYVLNVSSGTSALLAGLKIIGSEGDEIIIPNFTFAGVAHAVLMAGLTPVVVDVNKSLSIDPDKLTDAINPKTKAVILTHMQGQSADIKPVTEICTSKSIALIEDCAQSFGVEYDGRKTGSSGYFSIYSFNVNKIITTGEGGAISTENDKLYSALHEFHDNGGNKLAGQFVPKSIGLNLRMTELSAAVGRAQLKKLDQIKQTIGRNYNHLAASLDPKIPIRLQNTHSNNIPYSLCIFCNTPTHADFFTNALRKENINAFQMYDSHSLSRLDYLQGKARFTNLDDMLLRTAVFVQINVNHSTQNMKDIAETINNIYGRTQ